MNKLWELVDRVTFWIMRGKLVPPWLWEYPDVTDVTYDWLDNVSADDYTAETTTTEVTE